MAVIGPFNFPAHLANGHMVPALLMGNAVVFKPSDKAPASGAFLAGMLNEALRAELGGAHAGIVNLVQGGAEVASALVNHAGLDAIAFTGSWPVGRAIMAANLDRPGRLLALEMGGNSAAVVMPDADLLAAGIEVVRSGYVTAGQRCTCTRRVIVHREIAGKFIKALAKAASNLMVGDPRGGSGPVFMGPVISGAARESVMAAQRSLSDAGGEVLVESAAIEVAGCAGGFFVTPGLTRVARLERAGVSAEREVFGPHLAVSEAASLDDAIEQANATNFGLAASIFTRDARAMERFVTEARAGCVNVNTGTAGASSKLPFGGLGVSGNHRPAGAFALDYCAYPVASMVEHGTAAPAPPEGMRFPVSWLET
jgi:succinylglutamic semialdehyde dehydrogenase